ncbi:hypothetical protein AAAC51_34250 [Priestia megaterium]
MIGPTDECGEKEHYKKEKQAGPAYYHTAPYTYPSPQNPYYHPQSPYHYRYW